METRALFGGAITCPVRTTFLDASQIRQIPDNQEVFVDMQSQQSLIIELLEPVQAQNEAIARAHFDQLASDNDATEQTVEGITQLLPGTDLPHLPPTTTTAYLLRGRQKVAKFNKSTFDTVEILLAVVRLDNVATDIVITLNAFENEGDMVALLRGLEIKDWSLFQ